MPRVSPADIRSAIANRNPAPVYLILGDDDAAGARTLADLARIVGARAPAALLPEAAE